MKPEPLPTLYSMISDMETEICDMVAGANALTLIGQGSGVSNGATAWAAFRLLEQAESLKAQWQALFDVSSVEQGLAPIPPASRAPR